MAVDGASTIVEGATRRAVLASSAGLAGSVLIGVDAAAAASASALDQAASTALRQLYSDSDKARQLGARAKAVLIFPKIVKAGFIVGGEGGDGVLRVARASAGYFRIVAGSVGWQAGAQTFSYALFFISRSSLDYLRKSNGLAVGVGPSVVVADAGFAKTMNTTTLTQDVYAMPFGQHGLMAGVGLEGSKITRIYPGP